MYNYCHRASESAGEHLPQIREFITKIMDYFSARGRPGYSSGVNFVPSGPKAGSVTCPVHVYTESGQRDTYRLEDQREQSWLIKTKEVITVAQIICNAIRQANIPNCISIKWSHCYSLVKKSFILLYRKALCYYFLHKYDGQLQQEGKEHVFYTHTTGSDPPMAGGKLVPVEAIKVIMMIPTYVCRRRLCPGQAS